MSFKDNLKTIRKENYISQEDLAEMLGVSRQGEVRAGTVGCI